MKRLLSSRGLVLVLALLPSPVAAQAWSWPLSAARLTTNNPRSQETFTARVHVRPLTQAWLIVSSDTGPTTLLGRPTELGPDWWVLASAWLSGGTAWTVSVPVPPGLDGTELALQAVVHDPVTGETELTNAAHLRITPPGPGRDVLLLRQTTLNGQAPTSAGQADLLASGLRGHGHRVTVVDDAVPADTRGFDALLDCRFTSPLTADDADRIETFLETRGGVFLLSGPYFQSSWGQLRFTGIQHLLQGRLGMPVTLASGGNLSAGTTETVSAAALGSFLQTPNAIAGLPYPVEQEGGSFGPLGVQPSGYPIITTTGAVPFVYGMQWKPDDVLSRPVRGNLAVLFNGAPDALGGLSNPHATAIFENLVAWLDA